MCNKIFYFCKKRNKTTSKVLGFTRQNYTNSWNCNNDIKNKYFLFFINKMYLYFNAKTDLIRNHEFAVSVIFLLMMFSIVELIYLSASKITISMDMPKNNYFTLCNIIYYYLNLCFLFLATVNCIENHS